VAKRKVVFEPIVPVEPEPVQESSLFEDLEPEPELRALVETRPADGIPALDSDLSENEKLEFIRLLNGEITIQERARNLAHLSRMRGSKTAAVGLRAIQEINSITGLTKDAPNESAPMFQLPTGSSVDVRITKVVK